MVNICLCDDDALSREICKSKLAKFSKEHEFAVKMSEFESGESLLFYLDGNPNQFDIIILDVLMHKLDGIATAKALRAAEYKGVILFLSSNKDFAIDAFSSMPINYILKEDVNTEKFENAIMNAVEIVSRAPGKRLLISSKQTCIVIELKDIYYIEGSMKKILVHTVNGTKEINCALEETLQKVEGGGFVRCHKSYVVNCNYVKSFNKNEILLTDNTILPVGRSYSNHFSDAFFKSAFESTVQS